MQAAFQGGEHIGRLSATAEVGDDILIIYAHGPEFLNLQNARHIVVVIVAAAAVGGGVGGRQQSLFLHAQERAAGDAAGVGGLGDLEKSFIFHSHCKNRQKSTCFVHG